MFVVNKKKTFSWDSTFRLVHYSSPSHSFGKRDGARCVCGMDCNFQENDRKWFWVNDRMRCVLPKAIKLLANSIPSLLLALFLAFHVSQKIILHCIRPREWTFEIRSHHKQLQENGSKRGEETTLNLWARRLRKIIKNSVCFLTWASSQLSVLCFIRHSRSLAHSSMALSCCLRQTSDSAQKNLSQRVVWNSKIRYWMDIERDFELFPALSCALI